eukprot:243788-Hanusia_phi.AAC.1
MSLSPLVDTSCLTVEISFLGAGSYRQEDQHAKVHSNTSAHAGKQSSSSPRASEKFFVLLVLLLLLSCCLASWRLFQGGNGQVQSSLRLVLLRWCWGLGGRLGFLVRFTLVSSKGVHAAGQAEENTCVDVCLGDKTHKLNFQMISTLLCACAFACA